MSCEFQVQMGKGDGSPKTVRHLTQNEGYFVIDSFDRVFYTLSFLFICNRSVYIIITNQQNLPDMAMMAQRCRERDGDGDGDEADR